jgi:hypothetical protein
VVAGYIVGRPANTAATLRTRAVEEETESDPNKLDAGVRHHDDLMTELIAAGPYSGRLHTTPRRISRRLVRAGGGIAVGARTGGVPSTNLSRPGDL